jgi:hypothetical protein
MAKSKIDTMKNGIFIGIAFALLALFAAKNIEVLSFIDTFVNWLVSLFSGIESIDAVTGWKYVDYLMAGIIGLVLGIWVESR